MESFFYHFGKLNPKIRLIVFLLLTILFFYISTEAYIAVNQRGNSHFLVLTASIIATICWLLRSIYEFTKIKNWLNCP